LIDFGTECASQTPSVSSGLPMERVVLSTADWDNPLWTNRQHLSSRWARDGHRAPYIEPLGLRGPTFSGGDVRRVWRRLRRANRVRGTSEEVWVLSPLALPWHGLRLARQLNRWWLRRPVRWEIRRLRLKRPVLWTYNPLTLNYLGDLAWRSIVYHCVDELSASPGTPQGISRSQGTRTSRTGRSRDRDIAPHSRRRRPMVAQRQVPPNCSRLASLARADDLDTRLPDDIASLPRPRIGFIGAVAAYKIELDALSAIFSELRGMASRADTARLGKDSQTLRSLRCKSFPTCMCSAHDPTRNSPPISNVLACASYPTASTSTRGTSLR